MSTAKERYLGPAEAARRMGVSGKALRLYEARGFLKLLRSEAGWRTYGASEIARLHHISSASRSRRSANCCLGPARRSSACWPRRRTCSRVKKQARVVHFRWCTGTRERQSRERASRRRMFKAALRNPNKGVKFLRSLGDTRSLKWRQACLAIVTANTATDCENIMGMACET